MAKKSSATLPSALFNRALSTVTRAASNKVTPAYEMVNISVSDGKMTAHCFNGTMGMSAEFPVEATGDINAFVSASALSSLVGSMRGAVTVTAEGRKGLKVESGSVSVSLKGSASAELPELEQGKSRVVCQLTGDDLGSLLRVASCASSDPMLIYSSVLFDVSSDGISSWATDSFRAATVQIAKGGEPTRLLLPSAFVSWIRTISSKAAVTIKEAKNRLVVTAVDDNVTFTMATPQGEAQKFPSLSQIFEQVFGLDGVRFSLDASVLGMAAKQIKSLGGETVAIYTDGNNLCLRAKTDTAGYSNIIGTIDGDVKIFLSPIFLADGIALFDTPNFLFSATKSPLAVQEGDLRILFMPKNVVEADEPTTVEEETPSMDTQAVPVEVEQEAVPA